MQYTTKAHIRFSPYEIHRQLNIDYDNTIIIDSLTYQPTETYRWISPDEIEIKVNVTIQHKERITAANTSLLERIKRPMRRFNIKTTSGVMWIHEDFVEFTSHYIPIVVHCSRGLPNE